MKYFLDNALSKKIVRVTTTIEDETGHKIWDLLADMGKKEGLSSSRIHYFALKSLTNFSKLTKDGLIPDDLSLLAEVNKMYQEIWADKTKDQKKTTWATRKMKKISDGPPTGNDLIILATVAKLIETNDVTLLTFDHDFIVFADEIKSRFNVEVLNAGTIPD